MVNVRFSFQGGEDFNLTLHKWTENVTHAEPAFEAMADHQATIWRKQFGREGAYTGAAWSPLSPPYAKWKQKHYPGKPILQLTGRLMASMVDRPFGVDEVTDKGFVIGTDVPYAHFHQQGTDHMPARPIIGPPPRNDSKMFAKILQAWIVKGSVSV